MQTLELRDRSVRVQAQQQESCREATAGLKTTSLWRCGAKFRGMGASVAITTLTRARAGEVAATPAGAGFVAAAIVAILRGLWSQPGSR